MPKAAKVLTCVLLAVFLLFSLPVLYLCAMNIYINLSHGPDSSTHSSPLPIYIVVSAITALLDIMAIIGLIKIMNKAGHKSSRTQTDEGVEVSCVPQKYLRNHWFVMPIMLPSVCLVLTILAEFVFQESSVISAFGALSGLFIISAAIPLVIASIVLKGIKKITMAEMFVSVAYNLIVFFFVAMIFGSRG